MGFGPGVASMVAQGSTPSWDTTQKNTDPTQANSRMYDWNANWSAYQDNWNTIQSNWENVSINPGATQSELNFAWLSKTAETPKVRIATSEADLAKATPFEGTQTALATDFTKYCTDSSYDNLHTALADYHSNKVTVKNLKEKTSYYYQVFKDGEWQDAQQVKTGDSSNFSFFLVGDPQIGSSSSKASDVGDGKDANTGLDSTGAIDKNYSARNDSYNWDQVLDRATSEHPEASFLVSAGDQVDTGVNESQYAGYLSASALANLPMAPAIGNHEVYQHSPLWSYHFNAPNTQSSETTTKGATEAGTDYYYRYGDALFIFLDTNNYNCTTHENVIKKAVEENSDAKWRIAVYHQDVYGAGAPHSESDGIVLRTRLTPIFDKYKIDVALQGHDHTYSRTYALNSDGKQHKSYEDTTWQYYGGNTDQEKAEYAQENRCYNVDTTTGTGTVTNPKGTIYITANSGSGSKFYNLNPTRADFIAERSQTWTPSYSVVNMTKDTFSIKTYNGITGAELNGTSELTIKKQAAQDTKAAESKASKSATVNAKTVTAKAVKKAVKKAGATTKSLAKLTLGKKVKTVKKGALKAYKHLKTLVVKTKKLTKKSVKGSLKGSKVTTVKVNVGKKKADKKYAKKYKKIFTKKVCGKKVRVK
jgi:hypothetical protein